MNRIDLDRVEKARISRALESMAAALDALNLAQSQPAKYPPSERAKLFALVKRAREEYCVVLRHADEARQAKFGATEYAIYMDQSR